MKESQKRCHLIDEYRGFVVINMIAYHAIWDLVYMFGVDLKWYKSSLGTIWQQWICWSFILLSGYCWQMGKRHLVRGLEVFGAGALVSIVTIMLTPDARIMFGVLTLLGSSMLLLIPFDRMLRKIQPAIGMLISFVAFVLTYRINRGYLGVLDKTLISLPKEWYSNWFATFLGFTEPGFFSTDYFSIIPWFFLYVTGYYGYTLVQKKEGNQRFLTKSICPPLGWIGRHALVIYLLHQPVIYGVLSILFSLGE